MSKRLLEVIDRLMLERGKNAVLAHLCGTLNVCERTVRRWLKDGPPTAHDALLLARACGLGEEDAFALAREFPSEGQKKAG